MGGGCADVVHHYTALMRAPAPGAGWQPKPYCGLRASRVRMIPADNGEAP
jgi:hypothetical protein